jgi:hypothetical protein
VRPRSKPLCCAAPSFLCRSSPSPVGSRCSRASRRRPMSRTWVSRVTTASPGKILRGAPARRASAVSRSPAPTPTSAPRRCASTARSSTPPRSAPLAGALVNGLDRTGAPLGEVAVTDAAGRYELQVSAPRGCRTASSQPAAAIHPAGLRPSTMQPFPSGIRVALPISADGGGRTTTRSPPSRHRQPLHHRRPDPAARRPARRRDDLRARARRRAGRRHGDRRGPGPGPLRRRRQRRRLYPVQCARGRADAEGLPARPRGRAARR